MKTSKSIIAIFVLAIMVTAVSVVSCKKDNENALNQKNYTIQQTVDVSQIEDITSYLKDFKKKMTVSKGDEAYNLEDAAWHLASLANLEFCKVNVDYDNVQFDTIEMQVHISDGVMLLGDLNTAYEQMCTEIQQFKKGFTHNNQNLYYINVSITAEGNTRIALMTSFNTSIKYIWDHTWYFNDDWEACLAFDEYYSDDSIYQWNTTAARELERILNLIENHEGIILDSMGTTENYYIQTRNHTFDYTNTQYDPYHSGFYNESRVFVKKSPLSNYVLDFFDMVYCWDSYLGLGYDYISNYSDEHPICWKVFPKISQSNNSTYHFHQLYVEYGQLASANHNPYD